MNSRIQFDHHPDADALNAFAEQSLPVAERARILAHMAGCPSCREVVYLAQAAAEPGPAVSIKAQPQRSWVSALAGWRIALIPAAALAAIVAAVVWVQTRPAPPPPQMAKVSEPPSIALNSDAAQMVRQKPAPPPAPMAPRQAARVAPRPPAAFSSRTQPQPQPQPGPKKAMPPAAGALNPNSLALAAASAAPSLPAPTAQTRALTATHLDAHSASMARYDTLPAPPLLPGNGSELAPLQLNGLALPRTRPVNLPSGHTAVSSAAMLNRLLAVDSAGAVFLSQDAGMHWETVYAQWTGKAIQVQAPPQSITRFRTANGAPAVEPPPAPLADAKPDTKAVANKPAMLFRLVTDSHQTWVSADGKLWRQP